MTSFNNPFICSLPLPSNPSWHYKILQWNARSLKVSSSDFFSLLHENNCFFALLSETRLSSCRNVYPTQFHLIRFDHSDGYGGVAIVSHHSIHIQQVSIDPLLVDSMSQHFIDLVDIEAFTASKNPLKLCSIYIPSSSNPPPHLINNIFNLFTTNSIRSGDLNDHHPAWDPTHRNHRGDLSHSNCQQ